nr:HNH endonuclease [Actinomycetes bacterium]
MFDSAFRTPNLEGLRSLVSGLGRLEVASDDAERVDQIRLLEEVKAAAAAAQARVTTTFAASQRAAQVAAGVRAD